MSTLNRISSRPVSVRLSRFGAASVLTAAAVAVPSLLPQTVQQASAAGLATRALGIAASKEGAPYQWGATGPYRFDCSGLTLYSFEHAGKQLPRTAAAQYNSTMHIGEGSRRVGDLVFFHTGSSVYHVGIYAGGGQMWAATHSGDVVRYESIYQASYVVGRVR